MPIFFDFLGVIDSIQTVAPQVFPRFVDDDAAQEEQREQVRNGHQRIHTVGEIPDDGKVHHTADEDGSDIDDAVDDDPPLSFQVFYGFLAIVAPAEDGGKGEGKQTEGKQRGAYNGDFCEGGLGEGGTVVETNLGIGDDATHDDQSSQCTDDHCVPEGAA